MRFRLGLVIGFGAGYVLGARAGRQRYEELRAYWHQFMGSPTVHRAAERTKEVAGEGARKGLYAVQHGVEKAGTAVKDRLNKDGEGSEQVAESWPGPAKPAEP
jgi:hypothetical protein